MVVERGERYLQIVVGGAGAYGDALRRVALVDAVVEIDAHLVDRDLAQELDIDVVRASAIGPGYGCECAGSECASE